MRVCVIPITCEQCGRVDSELSSYSGDIYCEDCARDNYDQCECCGEFFEQGDLREVDDQMVCEECEEEMEDEDE